MVLPTGTGPLSDTIFILGLRPFAKPVPASGTHISAPLIHAGGTKALMTVAELDKLRVAFALHTPPARGTTSVASVGNTVRRRIRAPRSERRLT